MVTILREAAGTMIDDHVDDHYRHDEAHRLWGVTLSRSFPNTVSAMVIHAVDYRRILR